MVLVALTHYINWLAKKLACDLKGEWLSCNILAFEKMINMFLKGQMHRLLL